MDKVTFFRLNKPAQYIYSVFIVLGITAICYAFAGLLGYKTVAFILLVTVSLLAITFDILPVLIAATLSAFLWNFFFIPPRFTFHVNSTEDTILFFMYFIIAMINAVLTYKIRQGEKRLRLKDEKANSVKLYNTILDSLSHELRTPIAAIIAASDNLQTNNNLSEPHRHLLVEEISKAALRLNQQVENLLNISRLESGHIKPKPDWCDVEELIYDVVRRVEENYPGRKIQISISPNLPICGIDKGMLDQVIYNLLNNAAIHTRECSISIAAACYADMLQIIIEDNGQGFTNVDPDEVFTKFSRDRNKANAGSGLGLSIVKGFTEALNGTVEAKNLKNGGAQFTINIPVKIIDHNTIRNE